MRPVPSDRAEVGTSAGSVLRQSQHPHGPLLSTKGEFKPCPSGPCSPLTFCVFLPVILRTPLLAPQSPQCHQDRVGLLSAARVHVRVRETECVCKGAEAKAPCRWRGGPRT